MSSEEAVSGNTTLPHGFDLALEPILPAIDYCLQLPRSLGDTIDWSATLLYKFRNLDLSHNIMIAPVSLLDNEMLLNGLAARHPTLIICSPESESRAQILAEKTMPPLGVAVFDKLNDELRAHHWKVLTQLPLALTAIDGSSYGRIEVPPPKLPKELAGHNVLPSILDAHQLRRTDGIPFSELGDTRNAQLFRLHVRSMIYAIAEMERRKLSKEEATREVYEKIISEIKAEIQLPVAIGLPGVPRKYQQMAYGKKFKPSSANLELERRIIQQCVAHRAVATSGLGIMAEDVPDEAFQALASIEKLVIASPRINSKEVWRQLDRISRHLQKVIGEESLKVMYRANRVHAFTNFPVGLMRLPEHSSPLLCVSPVSIRPVLPLTRTLQMEMSQFPFVFLKKQLRVLIAECLEPDDKIRNLSDSGWKALKEVIETIPGAMCTIGEFKDPQSLAFDLSEKNYDILIISAHGDYDPGRSVAGLRFSTGVSLGLEFKRVPPLVILSACHSSPRGVAAVNIGDMLIRHGALAVLGTLIPVDVRRNATLMVRLFANIKAAIEGTASFRTFEDVWTFVAASNAFNEIMSTTTGLHAAMGAGSHGGFKNSFFDEFMMQRSPGRLTRGHIYKNTEEVLLEIASERGFAHQLRPVIEERSYFPESLFYTMIGRPDRIVFSDDILNAATTSD
ncbi:CHAT domain-containing protein [Cystobacter fuscus]|uniref:CHAT domain-containing protein n=1 Tax=Cystobacter fuscus TaxID=43 RepID=UPI0012FD873C|nr:CHAT domain-containing protein [Cystobacter fuscus]